MHTHAPPPATYADGFPIRVSVPHTHSYSTPTLIHHHFRVLHGVQRLVVKHCDVMHVEISSAFASVMVYIGREEGKES